MSKIRVVLILIGVVIAGVLIARCSPDFVPDFDAKAHSLPDLGYIQFEVDGMPCLVVGRRTSSDSLRVWAYDGVTCDWSNRKVED